MDDCLFPDGPLDIWSPTTQLLLFHWKKTFTVCSKLSTYSKHNMMVLMCFPAVTWQFEWLQHFFCWCQRVLSVRSREHCQCSEYPRSTWFLFFSFISINSRDTISLFCPHVYWYGIIKTMKSVLRLTDLLAFTVSVTWKQLHLYGFLKTRTAFVETIAYLPIYSGATYLCRLFMLFNLNLWAQWWRLCLVCHFHFSSTAKLALSSINCPMEKCIMLPDQQA